MGLMLPLVRIVELTVATLVITWALNFRSSFTHSIAVVTMDTRTSQLDHLYSVLHPLLMVIGFIVLTGEAIMAHRWLARCSRGTRKSVHLLLQGTALGFGLMGIWAKFHGERGVIANFYSLHSWMGLLCLSLFFSQWVVGFVSFWHRGEGRRARESVLPWHVFLGLYTYVLAVSTAETGLLEKLTFLRERGSKVATRSVEESLVNGLGLGLALLGGIVVFAAVSPKQPTTKAKSTEDIGGGGLRKNGYAGNGCPPPPQHHHHQQQQQQQYLNGKKTLFDAE